MAETQTAGSGNGKDKGAGKSRPNDGIPLELDNPEVREAITKAFKDITAQEAKRKACNQEISAIREGLKSRGLNMAAINAVFARMKMTESQSAGFAQSYAVGSAALQLELKIVETQGVTKH